MSLLENNIRLLKNMDFPLRLISDNQMIQEIDDNYDGLNTLNNLSFSIYYTFQETFQEIKDMWDINLAKDKLNDLEIILDNLYDQAVPDTSSTATLSRLKMTTFQKYKR